MNLKLGSRAAQPSATKSPAAVAVLSLGDKKHRAHNVYADEACPICQEPVGHRTPEGKLESWSRLPCGHKFGSHCIKHWLGILTTGERPCCPICRRNAAYICGHPVLPEPVPTSPGATSTTTTSTTLNLMSAAAAPTAKGETSACPGTTAENNNFKPMLSLATQMCAFCRAGVEKDRQRRNRRTSRPLRFVRGCWRLVRHGRIRESRRERMRAAAAASASANTGGGDGWTHWAAFRTAEWQKWWREQEPRNA
jgi:hypothetical protein